MDSALKEKWLVALRSNRFRQVRAQLYNPKENAYCCLGILCKQAKIKIDYSGHSCIVDGQEQGYNPIIAMLGSKIVSKLYTMNDNENASFLKIANWIEENIKGE